MNRNPPGKSSEEMDKRNRAFQKVAQMNMQFESLEAQIKSILHQDLMKKKEACFNANKKSADKFAECSHACIEQTQSLSSEMKFRLNFFEKKMDLCLKNNHDAEKLLSCTEQCEKLYKHIINQVSHLE